ncbi:Zinc transporter like [Quillaja saponaria]|uniref:Zinc transporter like n=1 Tax=Quillaja saponaria TaxID=32244 RepID=A0AAD7PQQ9_QUISA|nr:Zinc transporter like [Quillaja saponaria]
MVHFLSDSNETFEDLTKKKYPFAYMLACDGYLLTILSDSLISFVFAKQDGGSDSRADVELQGEDSRSGRTSQSQYQNYRINENTSKLQQHSMKDKRDSIVEYRFNSTCTQSWTVTLIIKYL